IGRLLISFLMRTPPFLFSGEKLLYQRRESSSYFLEIEGIFQLCPRKYFTHTIFCLKLDRSFGCLMFVRFPLSLVSIYSCNVRPCKDISTESSFVNSLSRLS